MGARPGKAHTLFLYRTGLTSGFQARDRARPAHAFDPIRLRSLLGFPCLVAADSTLLARYITFHNNPRKHPSFLDFHDVRFIA